MVSCFSSLNTDVQLVLRETDVLVVCCSKSNQQSFLKTTINSCSKKIIIGSISNVECYRKIELQIKIIFSENSHCENVVDKICWIIKRAKKQTVELAAKEAEKLIDLMQHSQESLESEILDYIELKSIDLNDKESCKDLIEVLTLVAKKAPVTLLKSLLYLKISPRREGGRVIYLEIAKALAVENCRLLAEHILEFKLAVENSTERELLLQIAQLISTQGPLFVITNIERFGFDCDTFEGNDCLLELAKSIVKNFPPEWLKYPQKIESEIVNPIGKKLLSYCQLMMHKNLELKSIVHLTAGHLSYEEFYKNQNFCAIRSLIACLEAINQENTIKIARLERVIALLRKAEKIALLDNKNVQFQAEQIKKMVRGLNLGESCVFSVRVKNHAMAMVIEHNHKNLAGHPFYKVSLHNTGDGIRNYHYQRKFKHGILYQTALEFSLVSGKALYGQESLFLKNLLENSEIETAKGLEVLYKKLLPSLGGFCFLESSNPKLWSPRQLGLSCTISCWVSVIRSMLNRQQFIRLDELFKRQSLSKLYPAVLLANSDDKIKTICALEIVKSLKYDRLDKVGLQDLELDQMQVELEQNLIKKNSQKDVLSIAVKQNPIERLLMQIQQDCYSAETKRDCVTTINQFLEKDFCFAPFEEEFFLNSVFSQKIEPLDHVSLTQEQICFITGVLAIISEKFKKSKHFSLNHVQELKFVINDIKHRIFALKLYQKIDNESDFGKMFHRCLALL